VTTMQARSIAESTEQTRARVRLSPRQAESTTGMANRRVPLTIPSAQAYFWGHKWQQAERETLAAFDAGQGIVFDTDDPQDILRWLHAPDDPDAG